MGINLFHGTDEEFFESTDERFDVISLDYYGMFTLDVWRTLSYSLFGRQILNSRGVLHTNFFGAREGESVKETYKISAYSAIDQATLRSMFGLKNLKNDSLIEVGLDKIKEKRKQKIEKFSKKPLKSLRDEIIDNIIVMAYMGTLKREAKQETNGRSYFLNLELFAHGLESKGIPYSVTIYLLLKKFRPYFCEDLESYRYISDDGSPMLTDIFFFDQHKEWFDEDRYPMFLKKNNEKMNVQIGHFEIDELTDRTRPFIKRNIEHANRVTTYFLDTLKLIKPRQNLGSSAKPILTKKRAIKLLKENKDIDWIVQNYRGKLTNPNRLRAYKAWITMGKYKNN